MMQEKNKLSNFNILLQFVGTQGRPESRQKNIRQQQQEPI